ncbi:MAG: hypothetical protein WAV41_04880 [Microgenomates group bacterium]
MPPKQRPLIILLILIIPSIFFFLKPGLYWNMHDDMQLIRQLELEKCLNDGQIPCRWTPDLGYGYGYPLFNFYPPLPYAVGTLFRATGFTFITTIKLTAALQFIFAAVGMYLLAATFYGPIGGLISGLLYTYAPYHAVNVYIRGAMNEAWASVFFPFIFYFAYLAIYRQKRVYYLLLSLSYALLLLSHNPMALTFSPFLGCWILYHLYQSHQLSNLKIYFSLFFSLLGSLCLSAYFSLPVIFESPLVQIETMFQNYYYYSIHFASFYQLFISNFWGDGPSVWGTQDGMPFSLGYLLSLISLTSFILSLYSYYRTKKINHLIFILFPLSVFSIFLAHERSTFIWKLFPLIQKIQFPWRFLNISTFLFSLLAGSIILHFHHRNNLKIYLLAAIIVVTSLIDLRHFYPVTSGPITDSQKFSGLAWTNQVTGGIYDYLPQTAPTAPRSPAAPYLDSLDPAATKYSLTGQKKGTDWLFFNISLANSATISLPVLYFPNFKLIVDNIDTPIIPDSQLGRISFKLNSGNHQVYLKLHDTPIRSIGNTISLFSILLFIYLFITTLWNQRKLKP